MKISEKAISDLQLDPQNARKHSEKNLKAIAASLEKFGQRKPIVVHRGVVIAGNGTLAAAQSLGWTEIAVSEVPDGWDDETAQAYALADNRSAELAEWDEGELAKQLLELEAEGWDIAELGFDVPEIDETDPGEKGLTLADKFLIPPLSIFDSRAGYWQERKRRWLDLGIKSEEGRDNNLLGFSKTIAKEGFTSIFDPVLCEVAYRWFAPSGAQILDPFAGGSVRGVLASLLERRYLGLELRAEQVMSNRLQAAEICAGSEQPEWIIGDSNKSLDDLPADFKADLIFSCPPYADLEVYSDDPDDISNMPHAQFLEIYRSIIAKSVDRLKDDRFAVWVISEVRDKKTGIYKNFVADTIEAFEDAGMSYYNEIILVNAVGNAAMRAEKFFNTSRKLARVHQNVLVFVKGDPKKATEFCGTVEVSLEDVTEV